MGREEKSLFIDVVSELRQRREEKEKKKKCKDSIWNESENKKTRNA